MNPWHSLIADIQEAMSGELAAIGLYTRLLGMAPTEEDRMNLQHILDDEKKHYAQFSRVCMRLTGVQPMPGQPTPPSFGTYSEGLKDAYYDELRAAQFYRSILLATWNPHVYRVFFEAMTDEIEHAIRLNRLLCLAGEAGEPEED